MLDLLAAQSRGLDQLQIARALGGKLAFILICVPLADAQALRFVSRDGPFYRITPKGRQFLAATTQETATT